MLLENGLLVTQASGRLKFNHPVICAYLAANALNEQVVVDGLFSGAEWTARPGWDMRTAALGFALSLGNSLTKVVEKHFNPGFHVQKHRPGDYRGADCRHSGESC